MTDSPADADDFLEFANQFLDENTHLFTILGIFGAIAVYLGRITTELSTRYADIALDIGIFSSLSLFILIGAMTYKRYSRNYSEFSDLPMFYLSKKNVVPGLILGLSLLLFVALIGAVSIMVILTLWDSWSHFLRLIGTFLFIYAFVTVNAHVPGIIRESDRLSWVPRLVLIILFCTQALLFIGFLFAVYQLFVIESAFFTQLLRDLLLFVALIYLIIMTCLIPLVYPDVD